MSAHGTEPYEATQGQVQPRLSALPQVITTGNRPEMISLIEQGHMTLITDLYVPDEKQQQLRRDRGQVTIDQPNKVWDSLDEQVRTKFQEVVTMVASPTQYGTAPGYQINQTFETLLRKLQTVFSQHDISAPAEAGQRVAPGATTPLGATHVVGPAKGSRATARLPATALRFDAPLAKTRRTKYGYG